LAAVPNRAEVIRHPPDGAERWTLDDALRYAGRVPNTPRTSEEKLDRVRVLLQQDQNAADAVSELLHRPEVAHRVMADPSNQHIVYRAHHQQRMEAAERRFNAAHEHQHAADADASTREVRQREPAVDYTRTSREVLELIGIGTTYLVELQRLIPGMHVAEFTDREVRAILDNHRRIRVALDWCDTIITTGENSTEVGLAQILEEGDDLS
jgi:hypothetical protein